MEHSRIVQVAVDMQSIGEHIIKILLFSKKKNCKKFLSSKSLKEDEEKYCANTG
jgi:hypothetical protein